MTRDQALRWMVPLTIATVLALVLSVGLTMAAKPPKPCQPWPKCRPSPTASPSPVQPSPTALPTPTPPSGSWHFASIYHKRIADLDLAVAAGLNGVRIVNWLDESAGGNPFDETRWAVVDGLIAGAEARGLRVLLDLSTYRNQLLAKGQNPYIVDWQPLLSFVDSRYGVRFDLLALAGEVEAPNGGAANRPTTAQLTAFYQRTRQQWQAISSVPVQSGGFLHYSWNSGIDWRAIFADMGYCTVHVYSQADIDFLPTIRSYCDSIGAPLLIEEFGLPISVGDSTRAAYYRAMYARPASAGYGFWNLGPETNSGSHDVNQAHPLTWAEVQAHNP